MRIAISYSYSAHFQNEFLENELRQLGHTVTFIGPPAAQKPGYDPRAALTKVLAARLPTVASPIGDIRSIVGDHRVGLLSDDDGFAEALNTLLTNNSLRAELGRNARRTAETEYSWPRLVDRLEAFYQRILTQSRR